MKDFDDGSAPRPDRHDFLRGRRSGIQGGEEIADTACRRTMTLCLQVLDALGIEAIIPGESRIMLAAAREALDYASAREPEAPAEIPATVIRREFVKSISAKLEQKILAALDHVEEGEADRLREIRDCLGDCATPDTSSDDANGEPEGEPDLRWIDPGLWNPELSSPLGSADALVVLAYTTYYLHLHEEEINDSDESGCQFDDMCRAASREDTPKRWLTTTVIASQLEVDDQALREAFSLTDTNNRLRK